MEIDMTPLQHGNGSYGVAANDEVYRCYGPQGPVLPTLNARRDIVAYVLHHENPGDVLAATKVTEAFVFVAA
jgi:hypothetical protein